MKNRSSYLFCTVFFLLGAALLLGAVSHRYFSESIRALFAASAASCGMAAFLLFAKEFFLGNGCEKARGTLLKKLRAEIAGLLLPLESRFPGDAEILLAYRDAREKLAAADSALFKNAHADDIAVMAFALRDLQQLSLNDRGMVLFSLRQLSIAAAHYSPAASTPPESSFRTR